MGAAFVSVGRLAAQSPDPVTHAAETITAAALAHHLAVLTADSMQARTTPSPALDRAARYVAAQWAALGVGRGITSPNGSPTWILPYPLPQMVQLDTEQSEILFECMGEDEAKQKAVHARFSTTARLVMPLVPEGRTAWQNAPPAVLLTGRPTAAFLQQADLEDQAVLYLPPAMLDSADQQAIVEQLYSLSSGVVVLAADDTAHFAAAARQAAQRPLQLVNAYFQEGPEDEKNRWAAAVPTAVLTELLASIGVDLASARTATAPAVRKLPCWRVYLSQSFQGAPNPTAPIVVGRVDAPKSQGEYVVVLAPMDQRDAGQGGDAAALSTAGLLELGRAFNQLPDSARPKRPIVFISTSGGASGQDFWASNFYAYRQLYNTFSSTAVAIGLDLSVRAGRAPEDTITIAGLQDVQVATPLAWVLARYPNAGLTVADGGPVVESRFDQHAFTRRGIPGLRVYAGPPVAADAASRGVPTTLPLDKAANLLRTMFYLTYELANANTTPTERPQWTIEGRKRLFKP